MLFIVRYTLMFCTTEKDKTIANSITWCLLILEVLYYFPIIESAGLDLPSALDEFAISYPTQKKKNTKLCFCVHSWWISTLGHGPNKSTLPCSRLVQSKVFEFSFQGLPGFGLGEMRIGYGWCWLERMVGERWLSVYLIAASLCYVGQAGS